MLPALITIISIALVLFILSFFMNDRFKEMETQFEQFSINTMQDTYQIKKKLKLLEEELLTDNINGSVSHTTTNQKPAIMQKVLHLYQQGYSFDEISKHTSLTTNDIQAIIRGSH